ncbi:MAG: hypothetical protein MZU97_09605 [Bacillus subtilis]|nr:hypothetical protein [Bacillus subtilis]
MREIARFPAVRRDIAVVVDRAVEAQAIVASLLKTGKPTLFDATVFDLYEGDGDRSRGRSRSRWRSPSRITPRRLRPSAIDARRRTSFEGPRPRYRRRAAFLNRSIGRPSSDG